jgi:hypothetical protein
MQTSLMSRCRLNSRWPAAFLLVAFLLPILLAVLPHTASAAVVDAVSASETSCHQAPHPQHGKTVPAAPHQCCVLCAAGSVPVQDVANGYVIDRLDGSPAPLVTSLDGRADSLMPRLERPLLIPRGPPSL